MPRFGSRSLANLQGAHPELQLIMKEAIKEFDFTIADGGRGRAEQEMAFKLGRSKVHFGDSAHNYKPWLALDIYPYPINLESTKGFKEMHLGVILPIAKKLGIEIRQGIDFNRNGILTDDKWDDLPHIELHPWRAYAKKSKLFEGK